MLGLIGINHNTAPLEIREKFAIPANEVIAFSEHLSEVANFNDIVVLSTCNRIEVYYSQDIHGSETVVELMKKALLSYKKLKLPIDDYSYSMTNEQVVRHLFRVTAGVDSMVIGEDQIIGQVKEAYLNCTKAALTDSVLMRLFQKSFEAGKRVRTETKIKMGATSISYVAVDMCSRLVNNLKEKSVLIVGAGETSALALQGLHKQGIRNITVSNRSLDKAEQLACKYEGKSIQFYEIPENLQYADIIITATGANDILITQEQIRTVQQLRNNQFQLYIDLSVPRNIDPAVSEIISIKLVTVDDLQQIIDNNTENRRKCIADAEVIIEEVAAEFTEWLGFRALRPAIRAIKYNLQKIHKDEMTLYNDSFSHDEKIAIETYAQKLITKYERALISNMKDLTKEGANTEYMRLINNLFRVE